EELGERRMTPVLAFGRQGRLRGAGDGQPAGAPVQLPDLDMPQLHVAVGIDGDDDVDEQTVVPEAVPDGVGERFYLVGGRTGPEQRPGSAGVEVRKVEPRTAWRQHRVRPPAREGDAAPLRPGAAAIVDEQVVTAVAQRERQRRPDAWRDVPRVDVHRPGRPRKAGASLFGLLERSGQGRAL